MRPEELKFLYYLKEARVPLQEYDFSWNKVANVQEQLEKLISTNYFLNLSAKEAYKAYVRAYDSHSLKNIFDVNTLDLVAVAKSFGFTNPPFVDLPVTDGKKARESYRKDSRGTKRRFDSNNGGDMNNKKMHKSLIYRAVPLKKGSNSRQFTR